VVTVLTVTYGTTEETPPAQSPAGHLDLGLKERFPRTLEARRSSGSGVILTDEGHLLTNHHVVEGVDTIHVRLANGQGDLEAKLLGSDPHTDIALLKIQGSDLTPIVVADSSALQRGDVVLALGSPFGLEQTATLGIVSATGRSVNLIRGGYEDFIQTDAPINPGNSGGALVDGKGRLVGINTAVYPGGWSPANSIGFAVPANLALRVANDLFTLGHVVRGYVGLRWVETSEKESLAMAHRADHHLAKVTEIEAGGPADKAGFSYGDVIVGFNGMSLPTASRLRYAIATLSPGSQTRFEVMREGKALTLEATLSAAATPRATPAPPMAKGSPLELREGLEVEDLTPAARAAGKIPVDVAGVLVIKAEEAGTPLAKIRPGDVITTVNGKPANNGEVLKKVLETLPGDAALMLRIWRTTGETFTMIKRK
jgi:serine protease Do